MPQYSNLNENPLKAYSVIPRRWTRPSGEEVIGNYNKLPNSELKADGWRIIHEPNLDPAEEKYGPLQYDSSAPVSRQIARTVVALTEKEKQDLLDNDEAATRVEVRKADGVQELDRLVARIERAIDDGVITRPEGDAAAEWFYGLAEPLYKGFWRIVADRCENATIPDPRYTSFFNNFKSRVDTYITENY